MAEAETPRASVLVPERLDGREAKAKLCENEDIGCMKLAWDYIVDELRDAIADALDCDLLELLAKPIAEAEALAEAARKGPGPWELHFGEQEVSRELHPTVAVTIGACPCTELEFEVSIAGHFSGLALIVRDGRIIGGKAGALWASAKIAYAGKPLHPKQETRRIPLPGEFRFRPPGLPIPRIGAAAFA
jgi:hypothetical protein